MGTVMPNINLKAPAAEQIIGLIKSLEKTTVGGVCEQSSFAKSTVASVIKELHAHKQVHIAGWERQRNIGWVKVYAWGKGWDLPEPEKIKMPKAGVPVSDTVWPQCDVAANWMRNPI
jgi:hypothetical protein